MVNFGKDRHTL